MIKQILLISLFCSSIGVAAHRYPATEVRAVWLTTNYGLDWPNNRSCVEEQKKEMIAILDNLKKYNFNTVMFQARARGEVLYQSKVEPMSSVIAIAPNGSEPFDPLAFVIEECHKRGMECHAWIITYPLGRDRFVRSLGKNSVTKKKPSIVKQFKGEWFLDPGNPETDEYLLSIVKEIVSNYDVDGIHFDYIRYPDNKGQFPDAATFRTYGKGKSLQEWRRDNITRFVSATYDWVKSEKPWVQVSSSPLGRYREINGQGRGWTAYETVYQDAGLWLRTGKHDALYPMMYYKEHLFYPFVDDWVGNSDGRIVVPGLGAYQMLELDWSKQDIVNQVDYTRSKGGVAGQAYFRADNVLSNTKGLLFTLHDYYKYPAKLPPMTWLSDSNPETIVDLIAEKSHGYFSLKWQVNGDDQQHMTFNIYRTETAEFDHTDGKYLLAVGVRGTEYRYEPEMDDGDKMYYYFVTASDAYHNEGQASTPALFIHSDTIAK